MQRVCVSSPYTRSSVGMAILPSLSLTKQEQRGLLQSLFFLFFSFCTLSLSSFWTSRGHRCHPFSSTVLAFNFYRAWGSAIPLLVDCSSSVANSRSRAFRKSICPQEKVLQRIYTSMHSAGLELTKLTYTRLEDNLIHHRGDRPCTYSAPCPPFVSSVFPP